MTRAWGVVAVGCLGLLVASCGGGSSQVGNTNPAQKPQTPAVEAAKTPATEPASTSATAEPAKPTATEPAPWTLDVQTDKLTDRKTLTATASVRLAPGSPFVYQLALKCDGTQRQVTMATFDSTYAPSVPMAPRAIPFKFDTLLPGTGKPTTFAAFRSRIDDGKVGDYELIPVSANVGQVRFPFTVSVIDFFSGENEKVPTTRLVVGDLFPGEQVEFPFSALKPEERDTIQTMCFPAKGR